LGLGLHPFTVASRRCSLDRVTAPSRDEAWELFCEWTGSESLRRHVLAVEAAMRASARKYGEDEELWAATGILHDLGYERHPDVETGHPRVALALFEEKGYPRELIDAVAGHAPYLGVPRESRLAKTHNAVDREELREGAADLGEDFDQHVAFVIAAMQPRAEELGLANPS
jgi:putative nucleotidyltransferase with HDIG domain